MFVSFLLSLCVMLGLEVCVNWTMFFYKDTCKCIFCLGAPACLNVLLFFQANKWLINWLFELTISSLLLELSQIQLAPKISTTGKHSGLLQSYFYHLMLSTLPNQSILLTCKHCNCGRSLQQKWWCITTDNFSTLLKDLCRMPDPTGR